MADDKILKPVFDPIHDTVVLGTISYTLREVPLGRVRRFRDNWNEVFATLQGALNAGQQDSGAVAALVDYALDRPLELLAILIPELDPAKYPENAADFMDEDTGATVPQIMRAFDAALEINDLAFLKKAVPFFLGVARVAIWNMVARASAQSTQVASSEKTTSSAS